MAVSYGFPKMFSSGPHCFLFPVRDIELRKQETFDVSPALTLNVEGFLGWKRFPAQETFCFLQGFLAGVTKCP